MYFQQDAETWDGWTPVSEALENHHLPAVKWLVPEPVNLRQNIVHVLTLLEFGRASGDHAVTEVVEKGYCRSTGNVQWGTQ